MFITSCDCDKYQNKLKKSMKEQRSISVPGINLEDEDDEENKDKTQPRPGSLFEVFMALKEKERYTNKIYKNYSSEEINIYKISLKKYASIAN